MAAEYGETPPWHDIQAAIQGPAVHDVETVFRERWEDPTTLTRSPVILLVSRAAFARDRGPAFLAALRACAERATVPVCIQLDHVSEHELMERAAELGCGAVMADGSKLQFDENVRLVAAARRLVAAGGAEVEGELGHLAGGEDVARAVGAGGLTDPRMVGRFVDRTGVTCLAVSIGNVHGTYAEPPRLDWSLLAEIRELTPVHLSLHGASGLDPEDVAKAIELGVTKVNVNLELRQAYMLATEQVLERAMEGATKHCRHAAEGCDTRLAEFSRYLLEVGEQYGIDAWLLAAMAYRESGLNPFAVGTRGEKGILQLHPKNRRTKNVRFVQDQNYWTRCQQTPGACQREVVERAAFILASSVEKCGGDLEQALGMYNTGRCGGSLTYAKRVLKERARLMSLVGVDETPARAQPLRVAASPRASSLTKAR